MLPLRAMCNARAAAEQNLYGRISLPTQTANYLYSTTDYTDLTDSFFEHESHE